MLQIFNPPGGAIGGKVGGGSSGAVLFVDSNGNLAQDPSIFTYASAGGLNIRDQAAYSINGANLLTYSSGSARITLNTAGVNQLYSNVGTGGSFTWTVNTVSRATFDGTSFNLADGDNYAINGANLLTYSSGSTRAYLNFGNVNQCYINGGTNLSFQINQVVKALFDTNGRLAFQQTALAAGNWAQSGFGAGATIAVTGTDQRGVVTVQTAVADTPTANPTVTLTFTGGAWGAAPIAVAAWEDTSTGAIPTLVTVTTTATTMTIKFRGTPTATSALTYKFAYQVMG